MRKLHFDSPLCGADEHFPHLPKGTDLLGDRQEHVDANANEINGRTRKALNIQSPLTVYHNCCSAVPLPPP